MERRDFFRKSFAAVALGAITAPFISHDPVTAGPANWQSDSELKLHKLDGIEFTTISLRYPR